MILTLRWRIPERPVTTRWRGPEGMLTAVARNPKMPIAAIVAASGGGDAIGPDGAMAGAVPVFDGTSGKLFKGSTVYVSPSGGHLGVGMVPTDWGAGGGSVQVLGEVSIYSNFDGSLLATWQPAPGGEGTIFLQKSGDNVYGIGIAAYNDGFEDGSGNLISFEGGPLRITDFAFSELAQFDLAGSMGLGGVPDSYTGQTYLDIGGLGKGGTDGVLQLKSATGELRAQFFGNAASGGFSVTDGASNSVFFLSDSTAGNQLVYSGAALDFLTDDGALQVARFTPSGRLLLGTTDESGDSKLKVAGAVESVSGGFKFPDGTTQTTAGIAPSRFDVASPAGTWIITHGLGRVPSVQVFLASGEAILPDITVDTTHITATFASPKAGFVLAS